MHVSKQKGRLLYHTVFFPSCLFFHHPESSVTNSFLPPPLTNYFPMHAAQSGSLMSSSQRKPERYIQGPGPRPWSYPLHYYTGATLYKPFPYASWLNVMLCL